MKRLAHMILWKIIKKIVILIAIFLIATIKEADTMSASLLFANLFLYSNIPSRRS